LSQPLLSDLDIALLRELSKPLIVDPLKDNLDALEKSCATKVLRLLSEGANPNALTNKGKTPLGLLANKFTRTSESAGKIIDALVDRGADPMRFDRALLKFSKSGHVFVKEEFVVCMVFAMCKKQAQAGISFENELGQNPIQVLVSKNIPSTSLLMLYTLSEETMAPMRSWLSSKNARGDTPLHILWKDKGIVRRLLGNENAHEKRDGIANAAWGLHQEIERIVPGQQWDKNAAGLSAYDLLSRRIDEGLFIPEDLEIGRQVISHRQAAALHAAAPANAPSRSSHRL
jgi:hypothetical protein